MATTYLADAVALAGPAAPVLSRRRLSARRAPVALRRGSLQIVAAGSTFGHVFRVTTFGESHGKGVGCVIDGLPPRLSITEEDIQFELNRLGPYPDE